jgi:hypothetical protein
MTDTYWAAKPTEDIAREIYARAEDYYSYLSSSGLYGIWKAIYECYYGGVGYGQDIQRVGDQGEFSKIHVNHLRNLMVHINTLTTQQQLSFDSRPANSDSKSQQQARLNNGLLDHFRREKGMERKMDAALEFAGITGEGFLGSTWDQRIGKELLVDPATQQPLNEGDIVYNAYGPLDVIRDHTKRSAEANVWYITRRFGSKWDAMAQLPELADRISRVGSIYSKAESGKFLKDPQQTKGVDPDDIPILDFYHPPTPALPDGRLVSIAGPECVLMDSMAPDMQGLVQKFPYHRVPISRIAAGEIRDSIHGYTVAYDLFGLQMAYNGLESVVLTNQSSFGVQMVWLPMGTEVTVEQIAQGLGIFRSTGTQPPQGINLVNTPAELFQHLELLSRMMETLSGVNSVARGNPEANLKSGAALALVQSQAIQFNNGLQKSYKNFAQDIATDTTKILQRYASTKRVAVLSGKKNRAISQSYSKQDIENVDGVTVEVGNALSRTIAGRTQIAEMGLQYGIIKDAEQLWSVFELGEIENINEGPISERENIRAENEMISLGQTPVGVATDNHPLHITEHKCTLDSPEARNDAKIVSAGLAHIQWHLDQWSNSDPRLLAALGIMLPPDPMALATGMTPPPGAGEPSGTTAPEPGDVSTTLAAPADPEANLPSPPKDPMTGQPAPMPEGASVQ